MSYQDQGEGVTRISEGHWAELGPEFGDVVEVRCFGDDGNSGDPDDDTLLGPPVGDTTATLVVISSTGEEARFTGYNIGFGGTGPQATADFLKRLGVSDTSAVFKRASLRTGLIYKAPFV